MISDILLWIVVVIIGITIIGEMRRDNKWKVRIEADLLLIRRQQETQIESSSKKEEVQKKENIIVQKKENNE